MSENKDERDIDEILASLDAMLAESQATSSTTDTRKEVVDQAARDSEDQLAITSSADSNETSTSTLQSFEPLDEGGDNDSKTSSEADIQEEADVEAEPRPRIILTEENLEPAAQESLPLWAEHGQTNNDETENTSQEKAVDTTTEPKTSIASEDITIEDVNVEDKSDNESLADELGDLSELDDINLPEISEHDDSSTLFDEPKNTSKADEETNNLEDVVAAEHAPVNIAEANSEQSSETANFEAKNSDNDAESDEFDAVFDAIANDDTITFDISEAMDEDTLYDIQVLDNELVEAFVQNVVHEHDEEQTEKEEPEATEVKEESADETNDDATQRNDELNIEDQAAMDEEASNHDIEADVSSDETIEDDVIDSEVNHAIADNNAAHETEPLAEHIQNSVQEAVEQDDLITLNPDELDPIIEAISDDVRIKVNQHLQQILPELISDALLEHLTAPRDDNT